MPDFLSEPQRWVIPAVLFLSAVGALVAVGWERRHPSLPENVVELRAWRRFPARAQAAADAAALEAAAAAGSADAVAQEHAAEAAHLAVERARINAHFHP